MAGTAYTENAVPAGVAPVAEDIPQRIFDSVLAVYVYYTKTVIDIAPAIGETIPNHTGNLVTATHARF